eukprot:1158602-Pelagomonas_calceolata.AAC.4
MSAFNADGSQQLHWGADFRLQSPDSAALQQQKSPATGKSGGRGRGSGAWTCNDMAQLRFHKLTSSAWLS